MIKLSSILLEKEDDGYVSIGFGRFKKKGQEDKDDADVYVKTDKGQFVKTKDQSSDDKGDDSEKKEKPKVNIFDKPKGDGPNPKSKDKPLVNKDDVYTDGEIETIVDKDVDEIKAMLYGKNPLAKYMSYKDDKYIQQHLDALKDTSNLPIGKEDFHKDELFSVLSKAQQNMEMGKVKQGERFSGDRKFLPKSKDDKLKNSLVKGLKGGLEPHKDSGLIKQTLDKLGDYQELKDKIDNLVDDIDNNSVGASEEEMERIEKKEAEVKNDIIKALSDKSKNENYNPSDKYLKESIDLLKRDFGQPLPTLQSVMEKHQKNVKEGPDDVRITKKQLQMLIKQEGEFRKRMMNIEQGFLRDPRPENKKLAKDIKKSYKDNVTKFMREVVGMLKRMK
jgi:hypothetical protein